MMGRYYSLAFTFVLVLSGVALRGQNKPNIIFILVDDQGYGDIGAFYQNERAKTGKPFQRSPKLDQLAASGAMLTHHYAAAPVCAPSRASILLGVSQGHANVRDNQFDKALEDNYTMASTLRTLGYQTAAIGKWGLQGDQQWDQNGAEWPAKPDNRGFDYFFGYMRHADGHEHYPKEGLYDGQKQVWDHDVNITEQLDKCYTPDLWTAMAKKWITEHLKGPDSDKPFFMYLAYDTPHAVLELPTGAYPSGGGLQGGVQWTGIPGHFINTAVGIPDTYIHQDYAAATYDHDGDPTTPALPWPDTYKRYATANRRIDDGVGDMVQLLKDLHIDSNTVVVYTSDNGPSIETYLGKEKKEARQLPVFFGSYGPFDGIKRDSWEGGMRVPAIIAWPGHIRAGSRMANASISYDWAPTFIEMAGAPVPVRMDGTSLLPSLSGTAQQRSSLIYSEYYEPGTTPGFSNFVPAHRNRLRNQMQLIRLGDYMGVRYDIKSPDDPFEIYNVVKDPQEKDNLGTVPERKIKAGDLGKITINEVEAYLKERVLQVRRPNVKANATNEGIAHRPFDTVLIPAVTPSVVTGLAWKAYQGNFPWIPQATLLKATKTGRTPLPNVSLEKLQNPGLLYYTGYIRVPADGNYTFYLRCAGKAFLRLHDTQLIDADFGYVAGTEQQASIGLKAGLHPFSLYSKKGSQLATALELEWSGPGISKQAIKDSFYYSDK